VVGLALGKVWVGVGYVNIKKSRWWSWGLGLGRGLVGVGVELGLGWVVKRPGIADPRNS